MRDVEQVLHSADLRRGAMFSAALFVCVHQNVAVGAASTTQLIFYLASRTRYGRIGVGQLPALIAKELAAGAGDRLCLLVAPARDVGQTFGWVSHGCRSSSDQQMPRAAASS